MLASGKIASGYDVSHHLGLTKFCIEPQAVVDKDTRKHLSTGKFCSERVWGESENKNIKMRDTYYDKQISVQNSD